MADDEVLLHPLAQVFGDIAHGVEVVDATAVNPLHHLVGAVGLLAHARELLAQTLPIQAEQVDPCSGYRRTRRSPARLDVRFGWGGGVAHLRFSGYAGRAR